MEKSQIKSKLKAEEILADTRWVSGLEVLWGTFCILAMQPVPMTVSFCEWKQRGSETWRHKIYPIIWA